LGDIGGVRYGEASISISPDYLTGKGGLYRPPSLLFGGGYVESLNGTEAGAELAESVSLWNARKMPALYEHGPFFPGMTSDAVLLYPESFDRPSREGFLQHLGTEFRRQSGQVLNWVAQRSYPVGRSERGGAALLEEAERVSREGKPVVAVVILWRELADRVHADLKEAFGPTNSQCVTEEVALDIGRQRSPKWTGRARNLALAIQTETGGEPWVLSEGLHADLFIGIDVLEGRVGYNFLCGTGGRKVFRQSGWTTRGKRAEAIKATELRRQLIKGIRRASEGGGVVRRMVIHRDGRWWPSESRGLKEAIKSELDSGRLESGLEHYVVEVRKQHVPVRLFVESRSANGVQLRNPLPGTHLPLDDRRVVLATTGRPGTWDSPTGQTAGTLLLNVVESGGGLDLSSIAEDAYRLTQLNWSAPDIDLSLPVTIRWADEALRETLVGDEPEPETGNTGRGSGKGEEPAEEVEEQ
jgi:hypothetical protein